MGQVLLKLIGGLFCVTAVVVLALGFGFGVAAFIVWIVMLLWNACLVGTVAGVAAIGFWKAWGILILFGMLFKGGNVVQNVCFQLKNLRVNLKARKAAKKYRR